MKKVLLLIVAMSLLLCGQAVARTYTIGIVPWAGWSSASVAEVKGFWKQAGLDVHVEIYDSNQAIHKALKEKKLDLGFDMIGTVVGLFMEGEPVVVLAETDWSHGGDKIIVKKGSSAQGLKGKKVGVYLNKPSVTYFLNKYLAASGAALSNVTVVEMETTPLADEFIKGNFGAIVSYDPDALHAERKGNGVVVATSATYPGCIPEGVIGYRDVVQGIPEADLIGILKGLMDAALWIQDPKNKSGFLDVLSNYTFEGDVMYSDEDLLGMLAAVKIHTREEIKERNRDGGGLTVYLSDMKTFLQENGQLQKDFTVEDIFYKAPIQKAIQ